jgi:hypothetical protein
MQHLLALLEGFFVLPAQVKITAIAIDILHLQHSRAPSDVPLVIT